MFKIGSSAHGQKVWGGRQEIILIPMRNWYLIYPFLKHKMQSLHQRNFYSLRKERRNNANYVTRCANVLYQFIAPWAWKIQGHTWRIDPTTQWYLIYRTWIDKRQVDLGKIWNWNVKTDKISLSISHGVLTSQHAHRLFRQ